MKEPEFTPEGMVKLGAMVMTPEAYGDMQAEGGVWDGKVSRQERHDNDTALFQLTRLKRTQAMLAIKLNKQLGKRVRILVSEIERIITSAPNQFDGPRVSLLNKLLDKLLPEVTLEQGNGKHEVPRAPSLQIVIQNVDRSKAMKQAQRVPAQPVLEGEVSA